MTVVLFLPHAQMGIWCSVEQPMTAREFWQLVDEFRRTVLEKRENRFYVAADEKKREIQLCVDVSSDPRCTSEWSHSAADRWWDSYWRTGISWSHFDLGRDPRLGTWKRGITIQLRFQPHDLVYLDMGEVDDRCGYPRGTNMLADRQPLGPYVVAR